MQQPGNLLVVLLGMGTVFTCLIILIFITALLGKVAQHFLAITAPVKDVVKKNVNSVTSSQSYLSVDDQQQIVVAIGAVLAAKFGMAISGKKLTLLPHSSGNKNVQ